MKRAQRRNDISLIIIFILIIFFGLYYYFMTNASSRRLTELMNTLNSLIDDSVYYSFFQGYGSKEYQFFVDNVNHFFENERLIDVLIATNTYDVARLKRFQNVEDADIALVELRKIQILFGDFILKQQRMIFIINVLMFFILSGFSIIILIYGMNKRIEVQNDMFRNELQINLLDILEKDRNIVSFELHDDLAQKLALINRFFLNPDLNEQNLQILKKYTEDAIQQIRLVSNRLKTPTFNDLSLKDSFYKLFSDFRILTKINLEYRIIGFTNLQLGDETVLHVYRAVQELLNNAMKHARAGTVSLTLIYSHPELIIRYKDDGIGFNMDNFDKPRGVGLDSIRFRMELLKAHWEILSSEGSGVVCNIRIPVT